jgi:DNA-binding transcriptional LysR family regulator
MPDLGKLAGLDLYVLRCLRTVAEERSVTRAAHKLGLSQPRLSLLLGRLRDMSGDPLFVRQAEGMIPTRFCLGILSSAAEFTEQLNFLMSGRGGDFDPANAIINFRVHASDFLNATVIARLCAVLRREAPGVRLVVRQFPPGELREALTRGDVDLALTPMDPSLASLECSNMPPIEHVCIVGAQHPAGHSEVGLESLAEMPHVALAPRSCEISSAVEKHLDGLLAAKGLGRRVVTETPTTMAMPAIVSQTDLAAIVPKALALTAAQDLPLQILSLPQELRMGAYSAVWHGRSDDEAAHRWLRTCLLNV